MEAGQAVATVEAMVVESAITTPTRGTVTRLAIGAVQQLEGGDPGLAVGWRSSGSSFPEGTPRVCRQSIVAR